MSKRSIFLLALVVMIAVVPSQVLSNPHAERDREKPISHSAASSYESMRGFNYLISRNKGREMATCDKFPRVCRAKGSAGPDCCKKKCVNVMTDNLNCGECGRRCRYGQTCCGGNCVDVMYDRRNCGTCKNRCKKGSFCSFGMCSYA
jgi:Stigma-specific protein, Stig1